MSYTNFIFNLSCFQLSIEACGVATLKQATRFYLAIEMELLYRWFHPTIDALSLPSITFATRLRLLSLQPVALLTYVLKTWHKLWPPNMNYKVIQIPTRHTSNLRRCLVYNAPANHLQGRSPSPPQLRPLHLDIHGGAFIGGMPEYDHDFCSCLAKGTDAVIVSASYRIAPRHPFPAAIDDVDDILTWLIENAEAKLGADINLLTMSGFSAGGNLAFAACQNPRMQDKTRSRIKGIVTFFASVSTIFSPSYSSIVLIESKLADRSPFATRSKTKTTWISKERSALLATAPI